MFGIVRNALVAALVAALGSMGVSFAVTGSVNPVNLATHASVSVTAGDSSSSEGGPSGQAGDETLATGSSAVSPTSGHGPDRSTDGCGAFTPGDHFNHGQFVKQAPKGDHGRSDAAKSDCGKPVQATQHSDENETETPEAPETEHAGQPQTHSGDHGKSDDHASSEGTDHSEGHGQGHGQGDD